MGQFWSILPKLLQKRINSLIASFFHLLTWETVSINLQKTNKQANKQKNKPNEPFLRKKLDEWVAETTTGRSQKRTDTKKQMPWQTEYFWTKQLPEDQNKKISSEDEFFTTFTNKARGFLMHSGGKERD